MKLFFHYCPSGFSNCYLLGTDFAVDEEQKDASLLKEAPPLKEAIIIDPGIMDSAFLSMIEDNDYELKGVLVTHDHPHHVQGLATIMRIYDAEIFAINPVIRGHRATLVRDGETIEIGPFKIEVISIPGHSADLAVFKIERFLFTGDSLSAGLVGRTASSYAAATQASTLRSKLLSLPGDYAVLPGHGPPTSLEAERRFNLGLHSFEQRQNSRPVFRINS